MSNGRLFFLHQEFSDPDRIPAWLESLTRENTLVSWKVCPVINSSVLGIVDVTFHVFVEVSPKESK